MWPPRLVSTFALLAFAPGCLTPPPPVRVETAFAEVRAGTLERAEEVGELADRKTAWIRRVCPSTRDARPPIWVVEDRISPFRGFPLARETTGLHFDFLWIDRIYVREDDLDGALTHELGHFLLGSDWDPLPPFLEEGLCDWLRIHDPQKVPDQRRSQLTVMAVLALGGELYVRATLPDGDGRSRRHATLDFFTSLPDVEAVSGHSSMGLLFGRADERLAAHALGYVIVERLEQRVGLDGILELCERAREERLARVPLEWVYEAAGLRGPEDLAATLAASLNEEQLELLVSSLAEDLLEFLGESQGYTVPSDDFLSWLDAAEVTVALPASESSLRLVDLVAVGTVAASGPKDASGSVQR